MNGRNRRHSQWKVNRFCKGGYKPLAIIATILGAVGFFWLNVASKDDIKLLQDEMNRQLGEIRADIKQLDQDYKDHLVQHNKKD